MPGNALLNIADPYLSGYAHNMPPVAASNWGHQPPAVTLQYLEYAYSNGYISEQDYLRRKEELTGFRKRLEQYRMSVLGDPLSSSFVHYQGDDPPESDAEEGSAVEEKKKCRKSKSQK